MLFFVVVIAAEAHGSLFSDSIIYHIAYHIVYDNVYGNVYDNVYDNVYRDFLF